MDRQDSVAAPVVLDKNAALAETSPLKATSGLLIGSLIIFGLAGASETQTSDPTLLVGVFPMATVTNVIDAAVPTSSTDIVAVSLGEAIAGVIGAVLTAGLKALAFDDRKPLVTEALADSDYFILQAGLIPFLEAVGISPIFASLGSVVVASVPSQLVKLNSKQKQRLVEEEKCLTELLASERKLQRKRSRIRDSVAAVRQIRVPVQKPVEPSTLTPIIETRTDFIEIFSDVTRWLGYSVLQSDYTAILTWNGEPAGPGITGAVFGSIAAFSSRLYADLLYGVMGYGPEAKQIEVRTRRAADWVALYASSSLSAATLFGVYEQSQRPISRWIQGVLAGGFEGCLGSNSFQACFDSYISSNAPGPSPEAQFRALATNLIMVGERLEYIASDTNAEDVERLIRAWAVSANSYMHASF
jgi:hypothetical protein